MDMPITLTPMIIKYMICCTDVAHPVGQKRKNKVIVQLCEIFCIKKLLSSRQSSILNHSHQRPTDQDVSGHSLISTFHCSYSKHCNILVKWKISITLVFRNGNACLQNNPNSFESSKTHFGSTFGMLLKQS